MPESGRIGRQVEPQDEAQDDGPAAPVTPPAAPARALLDGVEDLLDEIDEVLEENAEEFVRGYVQKGGE